MEMLAATRIVPEGNGSRPVVWAAVGSATLVHSHLSTRPPGSSPSSGTEGSGGGRRLIRRLTKSKKTAERNCTSMIGIAIPLYLVGGLCVYAGLPPPAGSPALRGA